MNAILVAQEGSAAVQQLRNWMLCVKPSQVWKPQNSAPGRHNNRSRPHSRALPSLNNEKLSWEVVFTRRGGAPHV